MKKCIACKQTLSVDSFYRRGRNGYQSVCKSCKAEYNRGHYVDHRVSYRASADRSREKRFTANKLILQDVLSTGCMDCGVRDIRVLEFDHRDQKDKKFTIGSALREKSSTALLTEISKCDVVCANCHRIRTGNRGGYWRSVLTEFS